MTSLNSYVNWDVEEEGMNIWENERMKVEKLTFDLNSASKYFIIGRHCFGWLKMLLFDWLIFFGRSV